LYNCMSLLSRCGNRHQKLGAYYFDEGFFT
jgi:hypothetical protein